MSGIPDDPMWTEFKPLWHKLQVAGKPLLVAGGYGLLLKQFWLLANPNVPIVARLEQWRDKRPRVTKDLDIVVGLELISSQEAQDQMARAMSEQQFHVIEENARWQFGKSVGSGRQLVVDFHSCIPAAGSANLQIDKLRVKHKPSLGDGGIHGRQNREAIACSHHPVEFDIEGTRIVVPHSAAWCI